MCMEENGENFGLSETGSSKLWENEYFRFCQVSPVLGFRSEIVVIQPRYQGKENLGSQGPFEVL